MHMINNRLSAANILTAQLTVNTAAERKADLTQRQALTADIN